MKKVVKLLALLLVFINILIICGCSDNSKSAIIYYGVSSPPQSLDPQLAKTVTELTIVKNIFEGLFREDKDGNLVPAIAESYEKNGNTYTFKLSDNAIWSNKTPITADDFVFAFQRALDPKTNAPDASSLFSIKNAEEIYNGNLNVASLGVTAINSKTLQIELTYDDPNFLSVLATAICMPCNKEFFNKSKGKYGMSQETIISNGSFELTKWNTEDFAMRLYNNENYNGEFRPTVAAIFLSKTADKTNLELLTSGGVDIGEIENNEINKSQNADLNNIIIPNTVWVLALGNGYSTELKRSLISSTITYNKNITDYPNGITPAHNLYPDFFEINENISQYDINLAKSLFSEEIKKFEDNELPTNTIYYHGTGNIIDIIKKIAGHWQQNLGAYINITELKSAEQAKFKQISEEFSISVYSEQINSKNLRKYASFFGVNPNANTNLQNNIFSGNAFPIAFSGSIISFSDELQGVALGKITNFIDFSFVNKQQ